MHHFIAMCAIAVSLFVLVATAEDNRLAAEFKEDCEAEAKGYAKIIDGKCVAVKVIDVSK